MKNELTSKWWPFSLEYNCIVFKNHKINGFVFVVKSSISAKILDELSLIVISCCGGHPNWTEGFLWYGLLFHGKNSARIAGCQISCCIFKIWHVRSPPLLSIASSIWSKMSLFSTALSLPWKSLFATNSSWGMSLIDAKTFLMIGSWNVFFLFAKSSRLSINSNGQPYNERTERLLMSTFQVVSFSDSVW